MTWAVRSTSLIYSALVAVLVFSAYFFVAHTDGMSFALSPNEIIACRNSGMMQSNDDNMVAAVFILMPFGFYRTLRAGRRVGYIELVLQLTAAIICAVAVATVGCGDFSTTIYDGHNGYLALVVAALPASQLMFLICFVQRYIGGRP